MRIEADIKKAAKEIVHDVIKQNLIYCLNIKSILSTNTGKINFDIEIDKQKLINLIKEEL